MALCTLAVAPMGIDNIDNAITGGSLSLAARQAPLIPLSPPAGVLDEAFTSLVALRELPDGSTLVTDARGDRRLAWIDWESGVVTTVGRRGDGPGEYSTPHGLYALAGDSTLLTDAQASRAFMLEGSRVVGTIAETHNEPLRMFRSRPYGADTLGRILTAEGSTWNPTMPGARRLAPDSMVVVRADISSSQLDTIAWIRGRGPRGHCMGGGSPGDVRWVGGCSPVFFEDRPLLFPDGWIALAHADPYRVDWRSPDGTWIRGDALPVRPVSLDERERCAALRGWPFYGASAPCDRTEMDRVGGQAGPAQRDWPEQLPPFIPSILNPGMRRSAPLSATLLATPDGNLLIRRAPTASSMMASNQYDAISREGELVGIIVLPANEAIIGFGRDHIYTIETDPWGLQWLRKHVWIPPSTDR